MRLGLFLSLSMYAVVVAYLSGCGLIPGGASLTLENYRIDRRKAESEQYRTDNKSLYCALFFCKKAPLHTDDLNEEVK